MNRLDRLNRRNRLDRRQRTGDWLRSMAIAARVEGVCECPAPLGPALDLALGGPDEGRGSTPVSPPVTENRG